MRKAVCVTDGTAPIALCRDKVTLQHRLTCKNLAKRPPRAGHLEVTESKDQIGRCLRHRIGAAASVLLAAGCRDRLRRIRRPLGGGRADPEQRDGNVGRVAALGSLAFFGFNAESLVLPIDARLMDSRALGSKLAVMPGAILRIPGGTPSQWIDWRTGRLIDAPGSPFSTVDQDGSARPCAVGPRSCTGPGRPRCGTSMC